MNTSLARAIMCALAICVLSACGGDGRNPLVPPETAGAAEAVAPTTLKHAAMTRVVKGIDTVNALRLLGASGTVPTWIVQTGGTERGYMDAETSRFGFATVSGNRILQGDSGELGSQPFKAAKTRTGLTGGKIAGDVTVYDLGQWSSGGAPVRVLYLVPRKSIATVRLDGAWHTLRTHGYLVVYDQYQVVINDSSVVNPPLVPLKRAQIARTILGADTIDALRLLGGSGALPTSIVGLADGKDKAYLNAPATNRYAFALPITGTWIFQNNGTSGSQPAVATRVPALSGGKKAGEVRAYDLGLGMSGTTQVRVLYLVPDTMVTRTGRAARVNLSGLNGAHYAYAGLWHPAKVVIYDRDMVVINNTVVVNPRTRPLVRTSICSVAIGSRQAVFVRPNGLLDPVQVRVDQLGQSLSRLVFNAETDRFGVAAPSGNWLFASNTEAGSLLGGLGSRSYAAAPAVAPGVNKKVAGNVTVHDQGIVTCGGQSAHALYLVPNGTGGGHTQASLSGAGHWGYIYLTGPTLILDFFYQDELLVNYVPVS